MWVPPFGNLRIKGYLRLPAAYRSLSRPSSATGAKASSLRSFMLNLCEHPSGHSIANHVSATVLLSCLSSFEFLRIIRHLLVFLPLWLKLFLLPHYNFLPCSFPTYCCLLILHLIIQFFYVCSFNIKDPITPNSVKSVPHKKCLHECIVNIQYYSHHFTPKTTSANVFRTV